MLPIGGIYEVAIKVKELSPAEGFYQEILGLEVGIRNLRRNWLFLRAGGDAGMIVLQEEKSEFPPQLFAFTITEADIERAAESLRGRGVDVQRPVFHARIPAKSLYLDDPGRNALDFCAPVNGSWDLQQMEIRELIDSILAKSLEITSSRAMLAGISRIDASGRGNITEQNRGLT